MARRRTPPVGGKAAVSGGERPRKWGVPCHCNPALASPKMSPRPSLTLTVWFVFRVLLAREKSALCVSRGGLADEYARARARHLQINKGRDPLTASSRPVASRSLVRLAACPSRPPRPATRRQGVALPACPKVRPALQLGPRARRRSLSAQWNRRRSRTAVSVALCTRGLGRRRAPTPARGAGAGRSNRAPTTRNGCRGGS